MGGMVGSSSVNGGGGRGVKIACPLCSSLNMLILCNPYHELYEIKSVSFKFQLLNFSF